MTESASKETKTLIDELLQEQRLLTAVTRFAQKHESEQIPLQTQYYRDLLPLSNPGKGQQYAFEVDLDRCSGCKACVAACHSLNGLEQDESWRAVGLLVTDEIESPYQQTVTTACHHCVDPACLNGCPVLAYEKDPVTGIVRHLDDQCIGCQYCVLKCPYEVPQYSERLGIVRKCDMCHSRLASGEAPACVQSCPSTAIRISIVDNAVIASEYLAPTRAEPFLPASPDPTYTLPTTRYFSARGLPDKLRAADEQHVQPAPAHWPLVFMLVLTQAGLGGLLFQLGERLLTGSVSLTAALTSALLLGGGLAASVLHLGRPLQAWRAFMGVRRSWLSREIIAFGALVPNALLYLAAESLPAIIPASISTAALSTSCVVGAAALFSSIMVYVDTRRAFWAWPETAPKFVGTTLLIGAALDAWFSFNRVAFVLIVLVGAWKIVQEINVLRSISKPRNEAFRRTAILLTNQLRSVTLLRLATLLLAIGIALFAFAHPDKAHGILPVFIFLSLMFSEILERSLFFRAVSQPKMPGGVS